MNDALDERVRRPYSDQGGQAGLHDRSPMGRILAMEDQNGPCLLFIEKLRSKKFLIIVVDRSIDMAAFKLILEATVNDHDILKTVIILAAQEIHEDGLVDPWQAIRLIFGDEVR